MDALNPAHAIAGLQAFLETGGIILTWIMVITFVMWAFIIERFTYWGVAHKRDVERALKRWDEWRKKLDLANDKLDIRYAHWIRDQIISEMRQKAEQNVDMVKTLVGLAPLFGLLGTVTGMVEVFDVMAATGNSSARAMSAGVSKATIPTMAGMVAAISGLFFAYRVERDSKKNIQAFADRLVID